MFQYILLCTILAFLLHWYQVKRRHLQFFKKLEIPGPPPNIFFGNALEVYRKGAIQCQKEWTAKYGRVLGYYYGMKPILLVSDTDLLKNIEIKDFQKFTDRPPLFDESPFLNKDDPRNHHLINSRGWKWKEMRSIITPSFTTSKMKQMSPMMNGAIDTLLANFDEKYQSGETFDASILYQKLTLEVILSAAFGIQTDAQKNPNHHLLKLVDIILHGPSRVLFLMMISSFESLGPLFHLFRNVSRIITNEGSEPVTEILNSCKDVIQLRKNNLENKRIDLLQLMIDGKIKTNAKIGNQSLAAGDDVEEDVKKESNETQNGNATNENSVRSLTTEEVISNASVFLIAGHETTSKALAFCTLMLVNYPEIQEKIRQEVNELFEKEGQLDYVSVHKMTYLDSVFNEVLRLYPPVYMFVNREATEYIQYGSIRIPKGLAVQVPVYLLHHDPENWPEPEKFIPERFSPENRKNNNPISWQPFGAGPRNCVGMRFAQMEAKFALAKIIHKYKLVPSEHTDKHPLKLAFGPTIMRPKYGVPIRLELCKTAK